MNSFQFQKRKFLPPLRLDRIEMKPNFYCSGAINSSSRAIESTRQATESGRNQNRRSKKIKHSKLPSFTQDLNLIDTDRRLEIKTNTEGQVPRNYLQILMKYNNSDNLVKRYMEEPSFLRGSDARGKDFSFEACRSRLRAGHSLVYFDYLSGHMFDMTISLTDLELVLEYDNSKKMKVSVEKIHGLVLLGMNSTFKKFIIENLSTLGPFDTFSMVTESRTYDFGSNSDTVKYDVCIVASNLAYQYCPYASIPLNKHALTVFIARSKIQEMAHSRSLFFKEIVLLAIVKSLLLKGEPERAEIVKKLLDKKFEATMKIFRFYKKSKPICFEMSDQRYEQILKFTKNMILETKRAFNFQNPHAKTIISSYELNKIKNENNYAAIVTTKKYLARKKQNKEKIHK